MVVGRQRRVLGNQKRIRVNEMSDFYKCRTCGSNKFSHDVSEIYEEVFDSEKETVVEGKHYNEGSSWVCKECSAIIPSRDVDNFLSQMYDATS